MYCEIDHSILSNLLSPIQAIDGSAANCEIDDESIPSYRQFQRILNA